jgi:hypothetical protein
MALPPKPILIRIVVYGALISFFGWRAYQHFNAPTASEAASEDGTSADPFAPNSSIRLKDGSQMPVLELTEEEFEERFGHKPPDSAVSADELEKAANAAIDRDDAPKVPDLPSQGEPEPEPEPEPETEPEPEAKDRLQPVQGNLR